MSAFRDNRVLHFLVLVLASSQFAAWGGTKGSNRNG